MEFCSVASGGRLELLLLWFFLYKSWCLPSSPAAHAMAGGAAAHSIVKTVMMTLQRYGAANAQYS